MRTGHQVALILADDERAQLQALARSRSISAALNTRAKIVLASAAGKANKTVAQRLRLHPATVGTWRRRFVESRITGLHDELRSG